MFRRQHLSCSFCGGRDTDVDKLVAGAHAYIRDRCVALAADIMQQSGPRSERLVKPGRISSLLHRLVGHRKRSVECCTVDV
jgi:ATP-dependent Clp protease ATP-binding subunit ClpX